MELKERLAFLESRLGHRIKDRALFAQALTHSSAKNRSTPSNERLEFLGDAVLGYVVSEYLYTNFPARQEGELSAIKSIIVSTKSLADRARQIGLEKVVVLGRGLKDRKGLPPSVLCNVIEAVIAALYLEGGIGLVRPFVERYIIKDKLSEIAEDRHEKNYKSILQDYTQATTCAIPSYRVIRELGPDHRKFFCVTVELDGRLYGPAWGSSKKEAEQMVARVALKALGILDAFER
jgi:ribonuclease-3